MTKTPNRLSNFLSPAEFAEQLGVCRKTVGRWIVAGDLHAHRFGRQIRISEDDAISFAATRRR